MSQTNRQANTMAIRHYVGQIWRERSMAIPGLVLPGIGNIFVSYIPTLIVAQILTTFGDKPTTTLNDIFPYLLLFGGTWFAGEVIWRIAIFFLIRADSRAMRNLYNTAMIELLKKDIGFFHNNFAGSLTKKAIGYGKSFETFLDTFSFSVLANLIPLAFAVVILWQFSPLLVAVLVGLLVIASAIIIPLTKRRRKLVDVREAASNATAGYIADIIGNIDAVQAFAHEGFEIRQHKSNVKDYMHKAQRSWDYHNTRIDMAISPFYVLINVIGLVVAIAFGSDANSLAVIFVTFNYYVYVTRVLWEFNRIYRNIENALSEAAQFTELLVEPPALVETDNPLPLKITRGEIRFNNVDFAYSTEVGDPLFQDFNLKIAAGEKLALVGHSGGGKTTITKLLLRFVDVTGGELLIDGQNIAESRLVDLRSNIAFVPQEPVMFHRSIKENIRYGRLDATDEQVVMAAKKAHAHEFIEKLPLGYDTLVGERGVKLSGGQRQRIAIGRAIIKDAPILVLDEATSALDSENEKHIQAALWELMEKRTAIVIAHRLSTIQRMDRIVVLENGSISEQGTHKELVGNGGVYASLWKHQSGGFIEE
ncbi:ABC transporter-related protein [candidate division TM7 genomosp. GTL1]|nr:ABC transporter-related protein [candidate division TM7 genomosp. GTL1]